MCPGVGAELAAGYHWDLGPLVLGPHLGLALASPHVSGGETNVMFTVNMNLELPFGRSTGKEASEGAASPPHRRGIAGKRRR